MANKKGGAKASPLSLDDELQAEATKKAGEAMHPLLQQFIEHDFKRPISSLSSNDIEWLAVAAISGWVLSRAKQHKKYGGDIGELIRKIEV